MTILKYLSMFCLFFYSAYCLYNSGNYLTNSFVQHIFLLLVALLLLKVKEVVFTTEQHCILLNNMSVKNGNRWLDVLIISTSIFFFMETMSTDLKNRIWCSMLILSTVTVYLFFSYQYMKKNITNNHYINYKTKTSYDAILYHEMAHASVLKYFDENSFTDYNLKISLPDKKIINKISAFLNPLPHGGCLYFQFKEKEQERNESLSYFFLLMFLSGNIGERILLNKQIPGSNSDMVRWKEEAENYLKNWYAYLYNNEPQNKIQIEENLIALEKLKSDQTKKLEEYFTKNREVFNKYFNLFKGKKIVCKSELSEFLKELNAV